MRLHAMPPSPSSSFSPAFFVFFFFLSSSFFRLYLQINLGVIK